MMIRTMGMIGKVVWFIAILFMAVCFDAFVMGSHVEAEDPVAYVMDKAATVGHL